MENINLALVFAYAKLIIQGLCVTAAKLRQHAVKLQSMILTVTKTRVFCVRTDNVVSKRSFDQYEIAAMLIDAMRYPAQQSLHYHIR